MGVDKARHHSTSLFILPDRKKGGETNVPKIIPANNRSIEPIGLV